MREAQSTHEPDNALCTSLLSWQTILSIAQHSPSYGQAVDEGPEITPL